jgi:hypothetical protein
VTGSPRERREYDDDWGGRYVQARAGSCRGSGVAETILPFIREIASPLDLEVILPQVNGLIPPMAIEGTRYFAADDFEARRKEAEMYLGLLGAELRNSRVCVHTRVRRGEPVDEILAAAQDEHTWT